MKNYFLLIMYISFVLNIFLFIFSIIKIKKRKDISYKFSDWIYKYSIIISVLINIVFFIAETINNTLLDCDDKKFYFFFILFEILWIISSFNFWIYSQYYVCIDEKKIVIHRMTIGKIIIEVSDIDKNNTYYFLKNDTASNKEYLLIVTKKGEKYKINLDLILYDGSLWVIKEFIRKQKIIQKC